MVAASHVTGARGSAGAAEGAAEGADTVIRGAAHADAAIDTDEPANAAAAAVRGSQFEVHVEFEVEHGPAERRAARHGFEGHIVQCGWFQLQIQGETAKENMFYRTRTTNKHRFGSEGANQKD